MAPIEKSQLPNVVPLPVSKEVLEELVDKAKDWALMHGACLRSKVNFNRDVLQFAPFILFPSAFPRQEFIKAVDIQPILNELMHKVAHNAEFLTASLKETIQVDDFTARLFKIFDVVQKEGITQPKSLGLLRSDYLIHADSNSHIKQVEFNTIACSFGGISSHIQVLNRYVLEEAGYGDKLHNLPENNALEGLCGGMIDAWKYYGNSAAIVLFIIEDVTYNICDQRFHEFKIRSMNPKVNVMRRNLTQISQQATLGPEKQFLINGKEVAVVYFRAGYEPSHYPSEKEWDARLLIERSKAIKCPSISYHLAGTKKVQQALARPGVLDLFLHEPHKRETVKEIFTGLYSLDLDEYGDLAVQMALDAPERFVLKPQREGGGNNVYGKDIKEAILNMKNSKERSAWILMERINPPVVLNYMVKPGQPGVPELSELISELGIFGVVIGDSNKIYVNKQVGHMLRTKLSTSDEGGVAAGSGALDSPYLID